MHPDEQPPEPNAVGGAQQVPILLGLGGNVGDVASALLRATAALQKRGVHPTACSALYRTAPLLPAGSQPQSGYVNAAVLAHTSLPPDDLVALCHRLPLTLGLLHPTGAARWQPRELDVDVLAYGEVACSRPNCRLPHPGVAFRPFVLWPVQDVAPGWHFVPHGRCADFYLARLARPRAGLLQLALSWRSPHFRSLRDDKDLGRLLVAPRAAS